MGGMITQSPINMPTSQSPLVDPSGTGGPTQIWWRFWFALLSRTLQTVPATVNSAVTAAGSSQTDATQLDSEWNLVTSTPSGSGVVLDGFAVGVSTTVFNHGGATLKVYPPSGMEINALGTNVAFSMSNGTVSIFLQMSDTQFLTSQ